MRKYCFDVTDSGMDGEGLRDRKAKLGSTKILKRKREKNTGKAKAV